MTTPDDLHINRVIELIMSVDDSSYDEFYTLLEDTITKKFGNAKVLENLKFKREIPEITIDNQGRIGERKRRSQDDSLSGRSSDNELVFTLLKDDLTCVTCRDMNVSAGNQLIECNSCHALYHQECHNPYILDSELNTNWNCSSCKYRAKKASKHHSSSNSNGRSNGSHSSPSSSSQSSSKSSSSNATTTSPNNSTSYTKLSSSKQYASTSSISNATKLSPTLTVGMVKSASTSSLNMSGGVVSIAQQQLSTSVNRMIIPNINIVSASADKRLQIMKRKAAAKIQEKRKPKT